MIENQNNIIQNMVEKITKGVKKQLKGHTTQIKNELNSELAAIKYKVEEWKLSLVKVESIRRDFAAVEMMILENTRYKKLYLEMRDLHEETRNILMDIKLQNIELQQLNCMSKGKEK